MAFAPPTDTGDPTWVGWSIFALYLVGGGLCLRAARRSAPHPIETLWGWRGIALWLFALGINKQLDLQLWLLSLARWAAHSLDFYAYRGAIHLAFASGAALAMIGALWVAWNLGTRATPALRIALLGASLLAIFALTRVISFGVVDLEVRVGPLALHEVLEAVGILAVACGAASLRPHHGSDIVPS